MKQQYGSKNGCTETIWRKEIPITRGYEYDLRDCRRVGLIMRCETAAQLRATEIRLERQESELMRDGKSPTACAFLH
jgi:hypothetical protein